MRKIETWAACINFTSREAQEVRSVKNASFGQTSQRKSHKKKISLKKAELVFTSFTVYYNTLFCYDINESSAPSGNSRLIKFLL